MKKTGILKMKSWGYKKVLMLTKTKKENNKKKFKTLSLLTFYFV
jgi:hypothetical protein